MTYQKIEEILQDLKILKVRGSFKAPNNRVIFEGLDLRVIVTNKQSEIWFDGVLIWTFWLEMINTKEVFHILEEFFEEHPLTPPPSNNFKEVKLKWTRQDQLDKLIL